MCLVLRDKANEGELERTVGLESLSLISNGVCTPHKNVKT